MDEDRHIEHLIERTLDHLDHPEALPPRPGLYGRVRNRMEARDARPSLERWHLRPALLIGLVVLNFCLAYAYVTADGRSAVNGTRQELLDVLSSDLNISIDESSIDR